MVLLFSVLCFIFIANVLLPLFLLLLFWQVLERLCSRGLSQELGSLLAECLWVRREEVKKELVRESCAISHSFLADYDWKMKVWPCLKGSATILTALSPSLSPSPFLPLPPTVSLSLSLALVQLVLSSDKLSSVQEPLLSLHLDLNEEGERKSEDIEFSKEELAKLISSLDSANKTMLQLRT